MLSCVHITQIDWNIPTLISHMQKFTMQNKQKMQHKKDIFDSFWVFQNILEWQEIFIYSCFVELWL